MALARLTGRGMRTSNDRKILGRRRGLLTERNQWYWVKVFIDISRVYSDNAAASNSAALHTLDHCPQPGHGIIMGKSGKVRIQSHTN